VILLDTNIVIDAHYGAGADRSHARNLISSAVLGEGAAINSITLAELYAGPERGQSIEEDMNQSGIAIFDLPFAAAAICGRAYRHYRLARRRSGGGRASSIPLPDFFIGAHAELMGWSLATRDTERFRLYFPDVELIEPAGAPRRYARRFSPAFRLPGLIWRYGEELPRVKKPQRAKSEEPRGKQRTADDSATDA
jgi:predicted nucleic acid-binding protein